MARARTGSGDLGKAFAASPQPIYLLNGRRVIVYANAACGAWLDIDVDQLIGVRCDYHSQEADSRPQEIAGGLCPPPEAFAAAHYRGEVVAQKDGAFERRAADFVALQQTDDDVPSLLAIVESTPIEAEGTQSQVSGEPSPAELHVLLRWVRQTHAARPVLDGWIGDTPAARRVREQFQAAVASQARVVVVGHRGSRREDLARAMHYRSKVEALGPLTTIDGAIVDAESLQSSITSLVRQRNAQGVGECPALLLIDADRMSPQAQHELRGFLEVPGFEVRTLATAERSLLALAAEGAFDPALAYALSTLVIELPTLRERLSDLPLLAQAMVEEFNAAGRKQLSGIRSEALERLAQYPWPGDLEQLHSVVHEACAAAVGPQVTLADLPRWMWAVEGAALRPRRVDESIELDTFLAEIERELLQRALARSRGNKSKAAKLLGISRPRLLRRMEQLGLAPPSPPSPKSPGPTQFEPL